MSEKGEKLAKASPRDDKPASRPSSPTPPTGATTLTVPATQPASTSPSEGRTTRSSSPSGLSTELQCKARSQISGVGALKRILSKLPESSNQTSLDEVQACLLQVDDINKAFNKEHSYLEVTWPAAHFDHIYFKEDFFAQELDILFDLRQRLNKFKGELTPSAAMQPTSVRATPSKLPDIKLPTFSGNYLQWPAFSELFTSLIRENKDISNIEKLQYLRSSLDGEPSQLVANLPLTGDSFPLAWGNLEHRYQNKRVIMQSQLDKLFAISPVSQKSATSLHSIAAKLRDINNSLLSLGNFEDLWNCTLVHHISRGLDKVTREAWETSLGSSDEFPKVEELEAFITAKARALERIEATTSSQPQQPPSKPKLGQRSALHAAQSSARVPPRASTQQYPCDKCQADHFIVSCSQFREMPVGERRKLIDRLSLCRNCCGRHTTANCKSSHRCKTCGAMHHSLLHLAASQPSAQSRPEPSTSQSQ